MSREENGISMIPDTHVKTGMCPPERCTEEAEAWGGGKAAAVNTILVAMSVAKRRHSNEQNIIEQYLFVAQLHL